MFLLLLMGLGAASVKAQVRIGGNTPPNPAAALDLNADDTNSGTKGLALPRVSLSNISAPLAGTPVVNGMMIYNNNPTTTGGNGIGIYYWDGNSWKLLANSSLIGTPVSFSQILDTTVTITFTNSTTATALNETSFPASNVRAEDICTTSGAYVAKDNTKVYVMALVNPGTTTRQQHFLCYRIQAWH